MTALGQPRFRTEQLLSWLYDKAVSSYDDMTNLPASLRERLAAEHPLHFPHIVESRVSADGTRKYLVKLSDDALVETVGIPSAGQDGHSSRLTVCFSTQVGCPMQCAFCATGTEGFTRNLFPGEIAWQIALVARDFDTRVSNAVAMGQGEPFLNYENVVAALRIINHKKALGIGARHLTVSTCGIADSIRRFGKEPEQFTLAVSLHSAVQETRDFLLPRCSATPLVALKDALVEYQQSSGRRITFEYLLIKDQNCSPAHLDALIDYCKGLSAHINLLTPNPVPDSGFLPCSPDTTQQWIETLSHRGIEATLRASRGADIDGACGQLKSNRT